MKLAVLVEFFPPKLGSDRRIYEIMSRLSGKHDIHFVVTPPFRALSGSFMMGDKELDIHLENQSPRLVKGGISGHFIQIPYFLTKIWKQSHAVAYLLTSIILFPRIIQSLRRINPDIIVLNYPSVYTGILGFFAGKILRKPALLDFNDLIAQYSMLLLDLRSSSLKARLFVFVQDFLARNCSKVVATTELIRNYVVNRRIGDEKVFVVPNGVDPRFFCPKKDGESYRSKLGISGEKICMYTGRLDGWAGIDILTALCEELKESNLDTQILVVGGRLANREAPENLVVVGETPYEMMPEILNLADAVLVPFPDNDVSQAVSPLKLFEGMAMQKPVIASRVKGIEEVITSGKNGILIDDPRSVREWREAVQSIFNSRALARRMAKEARYTVVKEYDWNYLAEEYEKIFTS